MPDDEGVDGEYEDVIPSDPEGDDFPEADPDDELDIDPDQIEDDIPTDVEEPEGFDDGSKL